VWQQGQDMSRVVFNPLMDSLRYLGNRYSILLGTGESLLKKTYLKELIDWSNTSGANIHLLTNGLDLNDTSIDILKHAKHLWIQITLDGMSQSEIDPIQDLQISKVLSNLYHAAESQLNICLNYTLYKHNINSIPKLLEFAANCQIKTVYITPVRIYDVCLPEMEDRRPNLAEKETLSIFQLSAQKAESYGIHLRLPRKETDRDENTVITKCSQTRKCTPIVRHDGSILICWGREDIMLGKIPEINLHNILESKWRKDLLDDLEHGKPQSFCAQCSMRLPVDGLHTPPPKSLITWRW